MKTFNIKVEGCQVTLETDQKRLDALDQFVISLMFNYYRKEQPERLEHLINTVNANYETYRDLEKAKV